MAWSFRKRIKIIPGVSLNFSKGGISTSIGVRGASVTLGKNGAYLNTGIPGSGFYNRQKLSGGRRQLVPDKITPMPFPVNEAHDNIFSADIQEITSQNLQGIKEAIITAHEQRVDLRKDLVEIRSSLASSKLKLRLSYFFIIGFLYRSLAEGLRLTIAAKEEAIRQLLEQIDKCYLELNVVFEPDMEAKYQRLVDSFKQLSNSEKIWDVTSAQVEDSLITRSAASTIIRKTEVNIGIRSIDDIRSNYESLWFRNANGGDLYIYPNFLVMYSSQQEFALVELNSVEVECAPVRFIETSTVPSDTEIIDKTSFKVNKDGSADRRFKGNYQIPVVKYGEIRLKSDSGLHEQYQFSNYESTEQLGEAFREFQAAVKDLPRL